MSRARPALLGLVLGGCAPAGHCPVQLWWVGPEDAQDVAVIGDFNDWDPTADRLREEHPGAWSITLELPPGDHEYMFSVDGRPEPDPYTPLLSWDPERGTERSVRRVEDCWEPALGLNKLEATESGRVDAQLTFLPGRGGAELAGASATLDGESVRARAENVGGTVSVSRSGLAPGKHHLTVQARDDDGQRTTMDLSFWVEERAFSWSDALIYQVMIDRFADASGALEHDPDRIGQRAGGTLAGVRAQLEAGWFEEVGASVLWLSPVQPNPDGLWPTLQGHEMEGYHGYWPVSPGGVDPRLGTEAELRGLVQAAHDRGLRVILDVIPNHVHEQHPLAAEPALFHQDACLCGDVGCAWSENIETCWFADYLPDLDWENRTAQRQMVDSIVALAEATDVDGLRIDAVPMVPRAAVRELVWQLRQRFEQAPGRFYLLGETFTGPGGWADIRKNIGPHGLDGQFDFPAMWALRAYAAWGSASAAELEGALATSEAQWEGSGAIMAPFVGNHDVSRFLSEAAGQRTDAPWTDPPPQPTAPEPYERLVLAQAIALSLPGAPVLWQGDEVGLAGATDPDCRRPMVFEDALTTHQAWVLDQTRRLGRARRCSSALRRGDRVPLVADGPVYGHLRDTGNGLPAIVLTNASDRTQSARFTLPDRLPLDGDAFVDVLGGLPGPLRLAAGATTTLQLGPRQAVLLLPTASPCAELP